MAQVEWRNPVYTADGLAVDIELNHPTFGWIPFTASPDDPEEYGRELYAAIIELGNIAPYVGE